MQNIFVPKKIPVLAMRNRTVSMATHYMILNNGDIHRKSIISQPVFNIERKRCHEMKT